MRAKRPCLARNQLGTLGGKKFSERGPNTVSKLCPIPLHYVNTFFQGEGKKKSLTQDDVTDWPHPNNIIGCAFARSRLVTSHMVKHSI